MAMTIRSNALAKLEPRLSHAGIRRGCVDALPFLLTNGVAGIVMGVAYRSNGVGFVPATLLSIFVYSATAQAVTLGMWAAGSSFIPIAVACIATNARYLVMGVHLHQAFGRLRKRAMLPILFLLADASWLMTSADSERNGADAGYLCGAGIPMAVGWIGGTVIGYDLPLAPGGPLMAAAALLPAAFIVTLLPGQWRGRRSIYAWSLAAVSAAFVSLYLPSSWAMLIGGAIGTAVSMRSGDNA
ncbi:AzlC family ABC transporter permease [Bradyrhizobium manausense]